MPSPGSLACLNFRGRHGGEGKLVLTNIKRAEVVRAGHGEALGGAYRGAKTTKAALGHVDVELGRVDAFACSVRGFAKFFGRLDRLDVDAIYRAYLGALIANNAVIDLVMQLITAYLRHRNLDMWILNGGNTLLLFEITSRPDVDGGVRFSRLPKLAPG